MHADRDKVLQVFVNLLSNAVKFNRQGGQVEVVLGQGRPGFLEVRVRDTGIGIPKEDLERVFERNYRVRREGVPGDDEGHGIGLSLVRDILRLHGCTIRAESEEGRGSEFTFALPRAHEPGRGDAAVTDRAGAAETRDAGRTAPVPERRPPAPSPPSGFKPRFRIIRPSQADRG